MLDHRKEVSVILHSLDPAMRIVPETGFLNVILKVWLSRTVISSRDRYS